MKIKSLCEDTDYVLLIIIIKLTHCILLGKNKLNNTKMNGICMLDGNF